MQEVTIHATTGPVVVPICSHPAGLLARFTSVYESPVGRGAAEAEGWVVRVLSGRPVVTCVSV